MAFTASGRQTSIQPAYTDTDTSYSLPRYNPYEENTDIALVLKVETWLRTMAQTIKSEEGEAEEEKSSSLGERDWVVVDVSENYQLDTRTGISESLLGVGEHLTDQFDSLLDQEYGELRIGGS